MMASLEEENEVLLARYCVATCLPPTLAGPPTACALTGRPFRFRPRWVTDAQAVVPPSWTAALLEDGPAETGLDVTMTEPHQQDGGKEGKERKEEDQAEDVQQQQQTSTLLDMPEELLWLIWELARPTPEELCRWSLVCRRFDRVACGHLGLWLPFFSTAELASLLPFTSHQADETSLSMNPALLNPKELYRAARRSQYDRMIKRIDSWGKAVSAATSFFEDSEVATEKEDEPKDGECPKELFRSVYTYIQRVPMEPLDSFRMLLWRKVLQSLRLPVSSVVGLEVLSTPAAPLPMISVNIYPLPHRSPVLKYVIMWHLFPFHEPKVTAVDSEVYGLPPLPSSLRLKAGKGMWVGSKPTTEHLKKVVDMKMGWVQQLIDGLSAFTTVRPLAWMMRWLDRC